MIFKIEKNHRISVMTLIINTYRPYVLFFKGITLVYVTAFRLLYLSNIKSAFCPNLLEGN